MKPKPPEPLPSVQVPDIDRCIQKYVYDKTFSAAAAVASVGKRIFHRAVYGCPAHPPPVVRLKDDTLFDLASLTKPLATALAALHLVSRNRLDLGAPLSKVLPDFRHERFEKVTIDMLLDHTAGFAATRRFHEELAAHDARAPKHEKLSATRKAVTFVRERLSDTALEYEPGMRCVYSDLGFMVLGWVVEQVAGKTLDVYLERELYGPLGLSNDLFFVRLDDVRARQKLGRRVFAATEQCPWRDKLLQGEVHDPTAWAMGGVAGHAGLFGTHDAVWKLASTLWASFRGEDRTFLSGTVARFWTRSKRVRNTTRTLGWDTPDASDSMAGKRFSRNAVGHLGFTGTSIWIDLSTDCIGVVLANAVHPTRDGKDEALKTFRPRVYELIGKEAESLPKDAARKTGAAAFYDGPIVSGAGLPLHNPLKGPSGPSR